MQTAGTHFRTLSTAHLSRYAWTLASSSDRCDTSRADLMAMDDSAGGLEKKALAILLRSEKLRNTIKYIGDAKSRSRDMQGLFMRGIPTRNPKKQEMDPKSPNRDAKSPVLVQSKQQNTSIQKNTTGTNGGNNGTRETAHCGLTPQGRRTAYHATRQPAANASRLAHRSTAAIPAWPQKLGSIRYQVLQRWTPQRDALSSRQNQMDRQETSVDNGGMTDMRDEMSNPYPININTYRSLCFGLYIAPTAHFHMISSNLDCPWLWACIWPQGPHNQTACWWERLARLKSNRLWVGSRWVSSRDGRRARFFGGERDRCHEANPIAWVTVAMRTAEAVWEESAGHVWLGGTVV